MNSSVVQSCPRNSTPLTNSSNSCDVHKYSKTLTAIYSVVLLIGIISLSWTMHIMKSNSRSTTSIAVLNLIFAHFVFLFTVPFRIYYYVTLSWDLGIWWCKTVSAMIHIHMYMSFVFYVIFIIMRLITFHSKREKTDSVYKTHARLGSAAVWTGVLVVVPCVLFYYGGKNQHSDTCFQFAKAIDSFAKVINYILSTLIILVATVLIALQANVLRLLYRKDGQEFGAQLKNLYIALIMVLCFVPYHMFRLYYLEHIDFECINEVFLSLTTFNCLDMLTFLGRRPRYGCFSGRAI